MSLPLPREDQSLSAEHVASNSPAVRGLRGVQRQLLDERSGGQSERLDPARSTPCPSADRLDSRLLLSAATAPAPLDAAVDSAAPDLTVQFKRPPRGSFVGGSAARATAVVTNARGGGGGGATERSSAAARRTGSATTATPTSTE